MWFDIIFMVAAIVIACLSFQTDIINLYLYCTNKSKWEAWTLKQQEQKNKEALEGRARTIADLKCAVRQRELYSREYVQAMSNLEKVKTDSEYYQMIQNNGGILSEHQMRILEQNNKCIKHT